jgi:hypothetical protein
MAISWFCVWQGSADEPVSFDPFDLNGLQALVRGCPGLLAGHILVPTQAHDPHYPDAKGSPSLILQLDFEDVSVLEGHLRPSGYLACLAEPDFLPSLKDAQPAQQAMLTRCYPVADDHLASADGSSLSYWVEYAGPAEDENAWHDFYVRHHPHLLAKFPGIRCIEIYTPAVAICSLPLPVRSCMQRNKTVFDSAQAMSAAMQTPVRNALREDFHNFPRFQGASLHFPFNTLSFRPKAAR